MKDHFTRPNPEYANAVEMGYSTAKIPRLIKEYEVQDDRILFPREAIHLLDDIDNLENRTTKGESVDLGTAIALRPYQTQPVNDTVQELLDYKGATIKAPPGSGKTVCALETARRLGRKTIVLVHKSFLLNQWIERIEEFLGVTPGVIWQDRYEIDAPIVVAMMQTLTSRRYPEEDYRRFGLVITDEAHRASADSFREAVVQFPATYRLGVTATPDRKDQLEWIFYSHIGPVSVEMEIERDDPVIYRVPTPLTMVDEAREGLLRAGGKPDYVKTISFLVESEARNRLITDYVLDAVAADRKVIVFSERRKHLEDLAERFQAAGGTNFGFFVGGMSEKQRDESATKQVVFSTYSFAAEGLDVADLDACIMASPKSSIIQMVGRIQRVVDGKPQPVVVDFVDEGIGICRGLARKRLKQYDEEGWDVVPVE